MGAAELSWAARFIGLTGSSISQLGRPTQQIDAQLSCARELIHIHRKGAALRAADSIGGGRLQTGQLGSH